MFLHVGWTASSLGTYSVTQQWQRRRILTRSQSTCLLFPLRLSWVIGVLRKSIHCGYKSAVRMARKSHWGASGILFVSSSVSVCPRTGHSTARTTMTSYWLIVDHYRICRFRRRRRSESYSRDGISQGKNSCCYKVPLLCGLLTSVPGFVI